MQYHLSANESLVKTSSAVVEISRNKQTDNLCVGIDDALITGDIYKTCEIVILTSGIFDIKN